MEGDYAADEETANHVWGGAYESMIEGAYYARQMVEVDRNQVIDGLDYDPAFPVLTGWDIGVDDYTAVWFFQRNGKRLHAIDYHEFSGMGPQDIIPECLPELLESDDPRKFDALRSLGRDIPYKYGMHYFPHDVTVREWGGAARTRYQTLMATRLVLPMTYFDRERTHLGRKRLRRYRRSEHSTTGQFGKPLKDGNDHGADAFGEFAVSCGLYEPKAKPPAPKSNDYRKHKRKKGKVGWR